jgi:hypothetical protein
MGPTGDAGDAVKNEVQAHLSALKRYVDMKFSVLKSMMSGKGAKKSEAQLEQLRKTMRDSMTQMDKM